MAHKQTFVSVKNFLRVEKKCGHEYNKYDMRLFAFTKLLETFLALFDLKHILVTVRVLTCGFREKLMLVLRWPKFHGVASFSNSI